MQYQSLAIARINKALNTTTFMFEWMQDLAQTVDGIFDIEILGGLIIVVYGREGEQRVMNINYNRCVLDAGDEHAVDKAILIAMFHYFHAGYPATALEQGTYPARALTRAEQDAINGAFIIPGTFKLRQGWRAGDSVIMHGQCLDREIIIMPYATLCNGDLVEMTKCTLEAGNWQHVTQRQTLNAAVIEIDGVTFYIPSEFTEVQHESV